VTATGTVTIPGQAARGFTIPPGGAQYFGFPAGTYGGPITISASSRVLGSERVQYYRSFNEVAAQASTSASTDLYFPWYDKISSPAFLVDDVWVVNPGVNSATVTVTIPGNPGCTLSGLIPPGGEQAFDCPTGFGGPIHVHSNLPVLGSQKVIYGSTFNETNAGALSSATTLYSTWFDHASSTMFQADNIHVVAPGGSLTPASVSVTVPGCSPVAWQASPSEVIFGCPFGQGFGGPVRVESAVPVLVSQRVQYGDSFNEVAALDPAAAATTLFMPWYDLASSAGFQGDNVHVMAAAGALSPGQVSVSIPGCQPSVQQMSASELAFSCPMGAGIGGPVRISATVPVMASQRVQFYSSFNESRAAS
jgi:hypothetical protein